MDCHKILMLLTNFHEDTADNITDEYLKRVLNAAYFSIPENVLNQINQDRNIISDSNNIEWQYLHLILYTIKTLCNTELCEENPLFTVNQFRTIKTAIEFISSIGIIPSLIPQIKIYAATTRSLNFKLKDYNDNIFEKNKRLSYTIMILMEFFDEIILRPALMSQLDSILAALLQLSYAPLKKPIITDSYNNSHNTSNSEFEMTNELYTQLKEEQEKFRQKLYYLIENSPQPLLIKELMKILGIKNSPKWLQVNIKHCLTDRIMLTNGVTALTLAICDEVYDLGKCWDKLDVTARLVATSHGPNIEKYYNSVCTQILEILNSKNNKQGIIIAKCCIKALYDYKPDVCTKKILHAIMDPFLVKNIQNYPSIVKTEEEVTQCVENLSKLFITTDAEFKCLPLNLLVPIALPLFYLYFKSYKSIYVLRNQVRQLLLKMLADESLTEIMFSAFLNHKEFKNNEFGEKLSFCFGVNGGFEITSDSLSIEYEDLANSLFNLLEKDGHLSFSLFIYLLKVLPKLNDAAQNVEEGKLLEATADTMERIEKQLTAVKLLTLLSSLTLVQEAQIKNPESLLNFIKFFFSKIISNYGNDDNLAYEQDADILYTSLMLVKIILTDGNIAQTWNIFQDFVTSIKQQYDFKKVPVHVISIIEEIETIVKRKGRSSKNYYDLSADNKKLNEFDKAMADLADPLLPVRAHGIISLTKLIECRHPETLIKKDFLLCIFQENLDHDDSFIYLAAINGICAMSDKFPDKVIEILVQEFIGMTQQRNRDIGPETRAKLGEILVKTTRALGEMTPKYKSLLVNGFLCGTRDPDPLVRASSLSCLGEFCKIMGFRLGNLMIEILYCIGCIIKTDKDDGCRRAGVLVATLLLRGLGKDALTELGENLVTLYRGLKHLRDTDKDPVLQLHAQMALEEFDDIVQQFLFAKPKLEKSIFLLPS